MTAPRQMTPSNSPDAASRLATRGSSNAPGTHATVIDPSSTPWRRRPSRAPASSRSVIRSLKRAQTSATRKPSPRRSPAWRLALRVASEDVIEALQQVSHARLLGAQVADVVGVGLGLERHPLDDLEAEALEAAVLGRVVRQQTHRRDAQVDEDLGPDAVLAAVDRQAELDVGVDGVVALLLEAVGPQLVGDADAAALVAAQVDHHAQALLGDVAHGGGQLWAAVTPQRAEHVAGVALAVHAHED